jgi:hypothetical protein
MTEPQAGDAAATTPICGREIEAFSHDGRTSMIDVLCVRVGPPPRAVHAPGTTYRVTATWPDPDTGAPSTVTEQADSLWSALRLVRADLEKRGWLLPVAAARRDSHPLYADRHLDLTVVHRFADPTVTEGVLADAPRAAIGTVADQDQAHQRWLVTAGHETRP